MSVDSTPLGVEVKPISRSLRFEILRRDNHTCRYCGAKAPDVELQVDHVLPVALGGTNDPTNLTTACRDCNSGKGGTAPDAETVAEVDAQAALYAKAIDRAAEIRRSEDNVSQLLVFAFKGAWQRWVWTDPSGGHNEFPLPDGWEASIARFHEFGFNHDDMTKYVEVTMNRPGVFPEERFRYLCGCLWRELGNRQELARQLIESGGV